VGTSDDGNGKGGLGKAGPDVPEARLDRPDWKALGDHARDPWPLSRELFLVAAEDKVFLCHADGRTEVLYDIYPGRDEKKRYAPQDVPADLPLDKAALAEVRQRRQEEALRRKRPLEPMTGYDLVLKAGYRAHDPVPLAPRPRELVLPPQVDLSKTTGTLVLADAHVGRNMTGVQAGEVRKLLVLEILPCRRTRRWARWPGRCTVSCGRWGRCRWSPTARPTCACRRCGACSSCRSTLTTCP